MLILLRHAQTTANRDNIKAGQLDVPLTDLGISQAKAAGQNLRGYTFNHVFSSDLNRCIDTTNLATEGRVPAEDIITAEELRERSGGLLEGMSYPDMRKMLPPKKYKLWQRDYFEAPPMGESMKDVEERVIPYMKEYVFPLVNENKTVLVCSHEVTLLVIIGYIKKAEEQDIVKLKIDNVVPYFFYGNINV